MSSSGSSGDGDGGARDGGAGMSEPAARSVNDASLQSAAQQEGSDAEDAATGDRALGHDAARRHDADTEPGTASPRAVAAAIKSIAPAGRLLSPSRARARESLKERVRSVASRAKSNAADGSDASRRYAALSYVVRIVFQMLRQWARDRCPQQAASLAFQTILSIVPMVAVALAVLRGTNSIDAKSSLVDFVSQHFIPVSRDAMALKLETWSEKVTFQSLGTAGLITTILLAFVMINSLERVMNYIWRSERKRSMAQKFVVFYASATIGPFLLGTSLYHAARYGLTSGVLGFLFGFFTSFFALFLANYFLPSCSVRWRSAALGALVSAVLFELAKHGFNVYVTEFALAKYGVIYGAIAIVPLWLVWIYYSWLTLLLGVEVAHAVQNLHLLERVDRRGVMSLENELLRRVNGIVAARVMMAIAESYQSGAKVTSRGALADRFDLSDEVLERITARLKSRELLIEVEGQHHGFVPARPPSAITLDEVMYAFRGDDVLIDAGGNHTKLDRVLTELEREIRAKTSALRLDQLID